MSYLSGSATVVSTYTYTYSNPATQYLTQTNSEGVITGLPTLSGGETEIPTLVTKQPAVATIPAGLPTGQTVIYINGSSTLTSFTVSVGSSTTEVLGGTQAGTTSGSVFIPAGQGTRTNGGNGPTGTRGGNNQGTGTQSAAASSSSAGSASNVKAASAGIFGLGALFAALL